MTARQPQGLTYRAVSGMLWMAWGSVANAGLKIAVLIILARLLTPADFGVVSAALVVVAFGVGFAQLGFGPALVQRPTLTPQHESSAFAGSIVLGLATGAVVALAASLLAAFFRMDAFAPVLRALAFMFPLRAMGAVAESMLQRELRFRWLANVEVATYAIGYGVGGVVLALQGWGVWALVGAQLLQTTLKTVVLLVAHPPRFQAAPTVAATQDLLGFGTSYTLSYLGFMIGNQIDNVVVGRTLGPAALGLYSRAFQLTAVPAGQVADVADNVLFSTMARLQHDPERLTAAYLRAIALVALGTLPLSLILMVIAPELIHVALGPGWSAVTVPFQIFAAGMVLRVSFRLSDTLARATGVGFGRVWRHAAFAVLVLAGALVGRQWGVPGAAVGVLIALFLHFLMMVQLAMAVTGMQWRVFWETYFAPARCAALAGALAWAAISLGRASGLPALACAAMAVAVAVLGTALALWWRPASFLGPYGIWIRDTFREFLRLRLSRIQPRSMASGERA